MEAFSTRCIDECRILNEKEVRGCGFLESVFGPEIKRVLTTGVWLSPVPAAMVVFHQLTLECTSLGSLWKLYRLLFFFFFPVAFIVFKKSGSHLLVIKNSVGETKLPKE